MYLFTVLDPKALSNETGGRQLEKIFYETLFENHVGQYRILTDRDFMAFNKLQKFFCYFRHRKEIVKTKILFLNSSNRRLFFWLSLFKRINPDMLVIGFHHHFAYLTYKDNSFRANVKRIMELGVLKQMNYIITTGPYTMDLLKKHGFNNAICLEAPFSVNLDLSKSKFDSKHIITIGNVQPRKGVEYLIEALNIIKDDNIVLDIVGKYDERSKYYVRLRKLIKKYSLEKNVIFHGRVDENTKTKLLTSASLFAFPTLNEGFGLVIIEAMGHGLPVVAFNNSAIPYTVKDNWNGLLVNNKDSIDFANKITKLINDENLLKELGVNAFETYKKSNTIENFCRESKEFFMKLEKSLSK